MLIVNKLLVKDFERNICFKFQVFGEVNSSHSPFSEDRLNMVGLNRLIKHGNRLIYGGIKIEIDFKDTYSKDGILRQDFSVQFNLKWFAYFGLDFFLA
jgi:hypothetical protein